MHDKKAIKSNGLVGPPTDREANESMLPMQAHTLPSPCRFRCSLKAGADLAICRLSPFHVFSYFLLILLLGNNAPPPCISTTLLHKLINYACYKAYLCSRIMRRATLKFYNKTAFFVYRLQKLLYNDYTF